MATKYRVEVSFDLSTQIEPESIDRRIEQAVEDIHSAEDMDSSMYFSSQEVTCEGGNVSVTVEADDEDEAESLVREAIEDGMEYEDDNGFTWVVENVSFSTEAIEFEPTVEEAIEILSTWVEENVGDGSGEGISRVAKSAQVVLEDHSRLAARVSSLETRVSGLDEKIVQLSARLQVTGFSLPEDTDTPQ